ncbi:MAG: DUF1178 family protein [Deltaproteobacteria bacterium]|nr:DUF1178 family protein [Deltaproteobacteria bacterium]
MLIFSFTMIIFDLTCRWGHSFEGWFPNLEAFEEQKKQGLVQCQICGDTEVTTLLSGGHLIKKTGDSPSVKTTKPKRTEKSTVVTGEADPITLVKALRHYVKSNFEDVGDRFPDVARQITKGEAAPKSIYGKASPEEREKMTEEGIPHFVLPDLPPEFEN